MSLLVHGMIVTGKGAHIGEESINVSRVPLITRLSFSVPAEKIIPDVPHQIKKQEPPPVKKVQPEPVRKKKIKKKTVSKKPIEKRQVLRRAEPEEIIEPVRQIAAPVQVEEQQVVQASEGLMRHEREQYLHKLLSHIESFKFYPRAARKRSLEGDVKISFLLRDDGRYEELSIDGSHTLLVKATRHALESAMPLPVPPKDIGLSTKIEFVMAYSLIK
jgi:protein TonB